MCRLELFQTLHQSAFGDSLELQVETAKNPQSFFVEHRAGIIFVQLAPEIIDIEWRIVGDFHQRSLGKFFTQRRVVLLARDDPVVEQLGQHHVAPLSRKLGAPVGR